MLGIIRVRGYNIGLFRGLHSSSISLKPFESAAKKTGAQFNINSMFKDDVQPKKGNTSKPAANRFASMFDKKNSKDNIKAPNKHRPANHRHSNTKGHDLRPKPTKRVVKFEFNSGSEQAQNALKSLISKVRLGNTGYNVTYVDPATNKLGQKLLVDICNGLDLKVQGFQLIPATQEGSLPIIKVVKIDEMMKIYSDELALMKEQELLQRGSKVAQKVVNQRLKAEKKKSAAKLLNIFWKISVGDLKNQKRAEIQRRLAKGEKFVIYLKSKYWRNREVTEEEDEDAEDGEETSMHTSDNIRFLKQYRDEDALEMELKRREMIFEALTAIIDDLPCTYKTEGKLETKFAFNIIPKEEAIIAPEITDDEVSAKEARKQKKASKQKELEKSKQSNIKKDDDLDSLYLFKLDD